MKTLREKAEWLRKKGYNPDSKSAAYVENLFAFYHPQAGQRQDSRVEWNSWRGTNRPHHMR